MSSRVQALVSKLNAPVEQGMRGDVERCMDRLVLIDVCVCVCVWCAGVVERAAALSAQMEALRVSEEQARARVRALEDEQLRIAQV